MDNQTDPATAGAPTDQPVYGPPPVETYSRSEDMTPGQGYKGPSDIGSPSRSFSNAASAAGTALGDAADQFAGAPAGHGENTFNPVGANTWENFQNGLKVGAYGVETSARENSLQDSISSAIEGIKKAGGVDIPNPYEGGFADEATKQVLEQEQGKPTSLAEHANQTWLAQLGMYENALRELEAKHQENTPQDAAIRAALEPALNMTQYADQWVKNADQKAQADLAKSNGSLIPWLAQQGGEIIGGFRNPINLMGLFVGGPELGLAKSAVGRVLEEGAGQALTQMGLTGAQEGERQTRAEQLGQEHGFWPVMHDLENSALGGFIGGSIIKGIHELGAHLFLPADEGVSVEELLRRAQGIPPSGGWPAGSEGRTTQWQRDVADWEAQKAKEASSRQVVPYEGPPSESDPTGWSVEEGEAQPPAPEGVPATAARAPAAPDQGMGYPAQGVASAPSPGTPEDAALGGTVAFNNGLPKEVLPPTLNTPPEIANLPHTTDVRSAGIEARELDVAAAPPVPPGQTPHQALESYTGLIKAGENPDLVAKPLAQPITPEARPASDPSSLSLPAVSDMTVGESFIKDDKPVTFESLDPLKLETNPEVFQYKGGGNAQGVTARLKGVGIWDRMAGSDPMVIYQWRDGREDVSNGHQRTGLAKALDAQGAFPTGTRVPGFLFKEADGWSPQDVRAYAAKVNLQQGSGDVLDTARILRERPDIWDKSLPTSELKLQQAKGLAELSDDGWGMVINGHVKPDLAALVGQGMPDKSTHSEMLQNIIDFKNADQNSTRMMIADANAAGFREENQASLFGDNPVTRSLLRERAQVYSRVVQALHEDKKVFSLLDREADRIEAVGNVLAGDTNLAQADRATQLSNILEKLALRQGPISAALNRAANLVADGTKAPVAARAFLRDIDRLIREEGLKLSIPSAPEPRTTLDFTSTPDQEKATEELRQATATLSDDMFGSHPKTIVEQRQAIFDDMRQKLVDADMPLVQAEANAAVIAARYVARAERMGRTDPETLYRSQGISVRGDRQRANGEEPAKDGAKVLNQPATVPTFYSSVQRAVDNAKLNKASPEQWLATLKNLPAVKPEEVKWLGLEDWLKAHKGPVTKDEVSAYVRANQIEVNEVHHGYAPNEEYRGISPLMESGRLPKYGSYTLPGGENYREMLLTLPVESAEMRAKRQRFSDLMDIGGNERALTQAEHDEFDHLLNTLNGEVSDPYYKSSHWEEPNVLAHIRFDDREVSGGRALHVAEVQSDWHQAGRREGYGPKAPPTDDEIREFFGLKEGADPADYRQEMMEHRDFKRGQVPDAPFKTSWPELSMKRMIRYAAENGYDRITWDTGKTNAERYDLSKQVDHVSYNPGRQELTAYKDGNVLIKKTVPPEKLGDEIGKEAADRLLSTAPVEELGFAAKEKEKVHHLEGEGLKVGGSGMEGFYDKILPAAVDKLTKKFGGKTEWAKLKPKKQAFEAWLRAEGNRSDFDPAFLSPDELGMARNEYEDLDQGTPVPVHSLTLTPELKEAAINEGFPLFAKAGEGEARGRITMRDDSAVIDLFKKRNASTMMHEAGHKFLEEMASDAAEPDAPKQIKDDFKAILEWLGAPDAESINTAQHEKFARGFEQYLREGKAPSDFLRRAFDQFKEWLKAIYRTLIGLGKEIPDNIRAVMDRMIATDDEIAAARAAEHETLRAAPPTQQEAAAAQLDAGILQAAAHVDAALRADGTPLDHEIADAIQKELKPAPVEPGAALPREPAPRPGTKLEKTVDLRSTGLRPKGRGDGASSISAAQVAWSTAIQTRKPAIAGIGAYGWSVLKPTEGLPYGNPYLEVTPEGVARFYDTDLEYGEKASFGIEAFQTAKGSSYIVHGDGTTTRTKAVRADAGHEGDEGLKPRSEATFYATPENVARLGTPSSGWRIVDHGDGTLSVATKNKDGKWGIAPSSKNVAIGDIPTEGSSPIELWGKKDTNGLPGYDKVHFGNEITSTVKAEAGPKPKPKPAEETPAWYEKTAAGDQIGMPGVKPVSDADRAQFKAEQPMRGGAEPPPAGGLFDEDAKAQVDWMDLVPTDDGLELASDLKESLRPQTPEEKTFFQSVQPATIARIKRQKALALYAQGNLVKYFNAYRTVDGRRDIIQAIYGLFEDFGYSGHPSVRFLAEALTARTNAKIAEALEHFGRKTFFSNGVPGLVGGRKNRADMVELQRALFGEKTTPDMQRLAKEMLDGADEQRQLFNEKAGDTIPYLKDWGGPQSHNATAVYRAGGAKNPLQARANWIAYIDPLLDWTKMRDAQTGDLYARPPAQAERERILGEVWVDIVSDGNLKVPPTMGKATGASVANSRSDSRFFVFKDADSKIQYNKMYGEGDLLSQWAGHVRLMARDTALMTVFGPNPAAMVEWATQGMEKEMEKYKVGRPALVEGYKYDVNHLNIKAANAREAIAAYYQQFRGSNYDQGKIALAGTILKNVAMGALLGSSSIPHVVSNPFIQMTARYYGGVPIFRAIPQILKSFTVATKAEMLRSGLDLENGAYSLGENARYITTMQKWANASRWFPDRVSAWSGLHPFVEANRASMRRDIVAMFADLHGTDWPQLPRAVLTKMKGYGITESDWKIAQAAQLYRPTIGMAPWLRPTDIESAPLAGVKAALGDPNMSDTAARSAARWTAAKFGGYIMGETEVAVPSHSMRSRTFIVGNSNPNTMWGFLRHSAGLFKGFIGSFMITQLMANAEQATRGPRFLNPRVFGRRFSLPHAAFIWIAMTVLGTLSFNLKQMAAGKESPSLDPTTPEGRKTWLHGMLTGGAFGWMGDFLASDQSSYGRGPLESLAGAPASAVIDMFQTGVDAFTAATTKRATSGHLTAKEKAIEGVFRAARSMTPALSTLWYARAAYNRMVLDQLQQMADPNGHAAMRMSEDRLFKESNQRFWWRPGQFLPREYPWQHADKMGWGVGKN